MNTEALLTNRETEVAELIAAGAIKQNGRKIIVDAELAIKLFGENKN